MPAMNPFVGVSATQPREAASFNETLEQAGLSLWVGPWGSWFAHVNFSGRSAFR
jgi:hypothetical protein